MKLLDAAVKLLRLHGFSATSVDDLCREAGVTKGAFFHHFASKEALGVAAADHWSDTTGAMFAAAPYHDAADPLDRVLGYIDLRILLIDGPAEAFSCVAGTMLQETFRSSGAIRAACDASISGHAAHIERDLAQAVAMRGIVGVDPASLALHIQAALQGGFIIAKARDSGDVARDTVAHVRHYIELLFAHAPRVAVQGQVTDGPVNGTRSEESVPCQG